MAKTSAGIFSVTLRFRSRQQHLFKDSLGLIKRQIYHPGSIMKIGHEEASEKEKADFLHSLSLKHFAE